MKLNVEYQINEIIKTESKVYTVAGYEYIEGRSMKYILIHVKDGSLAWEYLTAFEIKAIKI